MRFKVKHAPFFSLWLLLAGFVVAEEPEADRPKMWAHPLKVEGVPNLYQVSDNLYRRAQPKAVMDSTKSGKISRSGLQTSI